MSIAFKKVKIQAPAKIVWDIMVEKVTRPDLHVPGVKEVKSEALSTQNSVSRSMIVGTNGSDKTVNELINYDPELMSVVFKLDNDPHFSGSVTNIIFEEDGEVYLDYIMHWTPKQQAAHLPKMDLQEMVENAVNHAKNEAEKRAKNQENAHG